MLSLTSFSGCKDKECCGPPANTSDSLVGSWILSKPQTDFKITLNIALKSTEGSTSLYQLTGSSPVNQYGADATLQQNGAVTVSNIFSTKRGGSTEAMNTETAYYRSLQYALKADIVGGKLKIISASDTQFSLWDGLIYDKQ